MAGLSDAASYSRLWLLTAAAVAAGGGDWGRQGLGRPGRPPGPPLDLRATLDRAGHARHAFLAVTAAPTSHLDHDPGEPVKPSRLTCGKIQHLLAALVRRPVRDLTHVLAWSRYRRTSAARARASHYTRQATTLT